MIVNSALLADTHCHLTLRHFDADREKVIQSAESSHVAWVVVPGIDMDSSREAVALAEQHAIVHAAVGFHPHKAKHWHASMPLEMETLARDSKIVAVGEIGLDYYRDLSPREDQRRAMREQLDFAYELGLPVIIHNREATADLMEILLSWADRFPPDQRDHLGVLHAFSADMETAQKAIDSGFYIGIAGPITYKNAHQLRQLAAQLPLNRLLIETDAPYLTPQPFRGKRNEPAYVAHVAEKLASVMREDMHTIRMKTSRNAANLFGWQYATDKDTLL
jgi:TatD DNase family protein